MNRFTIPLLLVCALCQPAWARCGQPGVVATVDGQDILQEQVDQRLAFVRATVTGPAKAGISADKIVHNLVRDRLLDKEANRLGITVTDEELAVDLAQRPLFMDDTGTFSQEIYERELTQTLGTTAEYFEAFIRRGMANAKLYDQALETLTDEEVDAWVAAQPADGAIASLLQFGRETYIEIAVREIVDQRLLEAATVEFCED